MATTKENKGKGVAGDEVVQPGDEAPAQTCPHLAYAKACPSSLIREKEDGV